MISYFLIGMPVAFLSILRVFLFSSSSWIFFLIEMAFDGCQDLQDQNINIFFCLHISESSLAILFPSANDFFVIKKMVDWLGLEPRIHSHRNAVFPLSLPIDFCLVRGINLFIFLIMPFLTLQHLIRFPVWLDDIILFLGFLRSNQRIRLVIIIPSNKTHKAIEFNKSPSIVTFFFHRFLDFR